jgi:hypothetical protein
MKHFTTEEWADFARDVLAEDKRQTMQTHLESGCRLCAKTVGLWQRVHTAAQREPSYEPPDSTLRTVKGMYALYGKPRAKALKPQFAHLLFDSLQAPLQAGVRSAAVDVRQLLYGLGDYRVDLRLEPQADSDSVLLLGQVLNSVDPSAPADAIPVVLLRADKLIKESATNRFGEFQFEVTLEQNLRLQIRMPKGLEMSIPLVDPLGGTNERKPADLEEVSKLLRGTKKSTRKKV